MNSSESARSWFAFYGARRSQLVGLIAVATVGMLQIYGGASAHGDTLTWSAVQSTTWDTTTANWSGSVYVDGDSVVFGDPIPSGGNVVVAAGGVSPAEVEVANTSGTYTISGGAIGGGGQVLKENGGTLILDSSNSYSGGTTISGGTLIVGAANSALGKSSGVVDFSVSGATLMTSGTGEGGSGIVEIGNNIVFNSQSAGLPFATNVGALLFSELILDGTLSGNSDVNFFSGSRNDSPLIELNSPAAYAGNTNLDYGYTGVLRLGVDDALPATTQLAFGYYSGALDLNGYNQTVSSLSDAGFENGITNTGTTTSTLTINQTGNTTYTGAIGTPNNQGTYLYPRGVDLNNINLVKTGPGALRLTGNDTYSGSTTISGGTLVVNGGISGGPGGITNTSGVSVTSGATLAGQGLISVAPGGQVVIGNGATISPGDNLSLFPTGVLTIADPGASPSPSGTFDLEAGGTLFISLQAFEAGGSQDPVNSGGVYDSQLIVAGNISLSGSLAGTLLSGFTANPGDLFFIIINQGTNPVQGTFAGNPAEVVFSGPGGTMTFAIGYTGNSTQNTFTGGNDVVLAADVPEPGVGETCLAGLGLLGVRAKFRKRR